MPSRLAVLNYAPRFDPAEVRDFREWVTAYLAERAAVACPPSDAACAVENPELPFWVPLVCWRFETVLRACRTI